MRENSLDPPIGFNQRFCDPLARGTCSLFYCRTYARLVFFVYAVGIGHLFSLLLFLDHGADFITGYPFAEAFAGKIRTAL